MPFGSRVVRLGLVATAAVATCLLGALPAAAQSADGPAVVHLPVIHDAGPGPTAPCIADIEVQSLGCEPSKALLLLWGEPGACPPDCAGPLRVVCSGLLKPGATWRFPVHEIPPAAQTGTVFGLSARRLFALDVAPDPVLADAVTADYVCQVLFFSVVGNCHGYRRFKQAIDDGRRWSGVDLASAASAPIAVELRRSCTAPPPSEVEVVAAYSGIAVADLGVHDAVFGGHAHDLALLQVDADGMTSRVHMLNAGAECTSVSLWLTRADQCGRARICTVDTLAPGEAAAVELSDCIGGGWTGSGWLRSTQPLAVVVDTIGPALLMSYRAEASGLRYVVEGEEIAQRTTVLHAPVAHSEDGGWSTGIQVRNRSANRNARVRLTFLDPSGRARASLVDWICPRGSRSFFLPMVADLPLGWRGAVRVESEPVGLPAAPSQPAAEIIAVARSVRYADIARSHPVQAHSYHLLDGRATFDPDIAMLPEAICPGPGCIGLIAAPHVRKPGDVGTQVELVVVNVVSTPGVTDFAIYLFDENGPIDVLCQRLPERQSSALDLDRYAFLEPGFVGSAVISAVAWRHGKAEGAPDAAPSPLGLAAVVLAHAGGALGEHVPGDRSASRIGSPIAGSLPACGGAWPACPSLAP